MLSPRGALGEGWRCDPLFLTERFRKLFGSGAGAKTMMVLLTSLLFGAAHWITQGLAGAEQATITGLVFGMTVMITGRIWVRCSRTPRSTSPRWP